MSTETLTRPVSPAEDLAARRLAQREAALNAAAQRESLNGQSEAQIRAGLEASRATEREAVIAAAAGNAITGANQS